LKVGDRILEINGADATKVPLSEAYDMLTSLDTCVTLLVEYNISVIGQHQTVSHSYQYYLLNKISATHYFISVHLFTYLHLTKFSFTYCNNLCFFG